MSKIDKITPLLPKRILYTMLRVSNLDRSIAFYRDILGMKELRRETFTDGKFTLVFMGYGDEASDAVIELTHNWGAHDYTHGTGFGHIALQVDDVRATCAHLQQLKVPIIRPAGPMKVAPDETGVFENIAFIEDPDGYRIELIEHS